MTRTTLILIVMVASFVLTGCTTVERAFPGQDPQHVWTTMIAVAETPDYSHPDINFRWFVDENHVYVDDANLRIEIYRKLHRLLHRPGTQPLEQRKTWKFQILLQPGDPTIATFVSRDWGVPRHAQYEAELYFDDVELLLNEPSGAVETPMEPVMEHEAEPLPEPDPSEPLIDIDELEPVGG